MISLVLADYFEDTQEIGRFDCVYCPSFRPATAIQLSRGPKRPLRELLTTWRHFGIKEVAALQR